MNTCIDRLDPWYGIFSSLLASLRHPAQPIQSHSRPNINTDVNPHQPKVPPSLAKNDVYALKVVSRVFNRTILAHIRRRWVGNIATSSIDVRLQVVPARLRSRNFHAQQLVRSTLNRGLSQSCGEEARSQVRERVHTVHEDPETWKIARLHQNPAKGIHHDAENVA